MSALRAAHIRVRGERQAKRSRPKASRNERSAGDAQQREGPPLQLRFAFGARLKQYNFCAVECTADEDAEEACSRPQVAIRPLAAVRR
jgi:hypothetical protein